jgi:hypothetical protein
MRQTAPEQRSAIADELNALEQLNHHYILSVRNSDVRWFDENLAEDFVNSNLDGSFVDRAQVPGADRSAVSSVRLRS